MKPRKQIQILSDIHLEHHPDGGEAFIQSLDPQHVDALVIAGDLGQLENLRPGLTAFCERFAQVVYVAGNHEYYGSHPEQVHQTLSELQAELANLHWLHHSTTQIDGIRFAGTTLWFAPRPDNVQHEAMMCDFQLISDFNPWVYDQNSRAQAFLEQEAGSSDVVITHHLPSERCVAPRFAGHPANRFFVCDMERLLGPKGPRLWIHGHTHEPLDFCVGRTRVLCNPLGYPREHKGPFEERLLVPV